MASVFSRTWAKKEKREKEKPKAQTARPSIGRRARRRHGGVGDEDGVGFRGEGGVGDGDGGGEGAADHGEGGVGGGDDGHRAWGAAHLGHGPGADAARVRVPPRGRAADAPRPLILSRFTANSSPSVASWILARF